MLVMGLDISTSITAYTLMDTDRPLSNRHVKSDVLHLSKYKSIYDKSRHTRDIFDEIAKEYQIDKIVAEEALQSFRRGLSSARTLSTLSRFNGIVCYLAEDVFAIPVELVNVSKARSSIGIKLNRKSEKSTKEQVLEWVSSQKEFEDFDWPTKCLKSGPRQGQVISDKSCFDIADASVVCMYGII
tara:strand:- start:1486 stop:2040 length:555 start_codon:yes stop_codon:yes gene_type:complete